MNTHWSERSLEDFRYRITSDFLMQLERKMETEHISRKELAKRLELSAGRVSQILNGSMENFEIESVIRYAKGLGMKVSIVAYDDDDRDNTGGPVDSEIFTICWERQGKPTNFFELESENESAVAETVPINYFQGNSTNVVHREFGGTANRVVVSELAQNAA